ncbi:MAG: hypothetical protein AB7E55_22410 [Pigmentiphaga sp.]
MDKAFELEIGQSQFAVDVFNPYLGSKFYSIRPLKSHFVPFLQSIKCKNLDQFWELIVQATANIEKQAVRDGQGWVGVSIVSKTEKGVRVEVEFDGVGHDGRVVHQCRKLWFPRAFLEEDTAGEKVAFLPAWLVRKKLLGKKIIFEHETIRFTEHCWPDHLKQEWIEAHLEQLPDEKEFSEAEKKLAKEREREREKQRCRDEKRPKEQAERDRELALEREEERCKKEARREERKAAADHKDVSVRWKSWTRSGGRFTADWCGAEEVEVLHKGKRAYIIFPDGNEIIKKKDNVEIVG